MPIPSIDDVHSEVESWFHDRITRGPAVHSSLRDRLERLFNGESPAEPEAPIEEPAIEPTPVEVPVEPAAETPAA